LFSWSQADKTVDFRRRGALSRPAKIVFEVRDSNGFRLAAVHCRDDLQKWSFGHSRGYGTAAISGCKVGVTTTPTGITTQLDTEDNHPGGSGLIGLAGVLGTYGSMCGSAAWDEATRVIVGQSISRSS
jgi:hypothetical protein